MIDAIVVVGHGTAARDTPRELVSTLRALQHHREHIGGPISREEIELDAKVRRWPRDGSNDPYSAGVEALAARMRAIAHPIPVAVAFNELCAPSVEEAVEALFASGARAMVVVTTMITPGGVHAERDIPDRIAALAARLPGARLEYAWPFDLDAVARLLYDRAIRTGAAGVP